MASVGALLSNYSRSIAVGAIHFSTYLVLGVGLLDGAGNGRRGTAIVFGIGVVWNTVLRRLLADPATPAAVPARASTPVQRLHHFQNSLRSLAGWQFAARLAIGLTAASTIRHLWPDRHFYWIMLTVALLTQRSIDHVPVKTVQRILGTIAGVGLTWIVATSDLGLPALALIACALATLVPVARARSYLLYSIGVTPLILLISDLGKPATAALLIDRIVATIVGGGLLVISNIFVGAMLSPATRAPGNFIFHDPSDNLIAIAGEMS